MTLAELQLALDDLDGPMLRVWWAPGKSIWCATLGAGVPADKLHAQLDVEEIAGRHGLTAAVAVESEIGHGGLVEIAILDAIAIFERRTRP